MPISKKAIEQKQETGIQGSKIDEKPKQIDNGLSNQYKYSDYDTIKL